MILSFHPCFIGDNNIIVAGREPNENDRKAILKAEAVILPQGCKAPLHHLARRNCTHVFPNYDTRFSYEEKIGQINLFSDMAVPYPKTRTYHDIKTFEQCSIHEDLFSYPFVFKFNWGGEGDTVFLIESEDDLDRIIEKAKLFEGTGQSGFLIQEYIPSPNRSLRVVVINKEIISYWRTNKNAETFGGGLSKGAAIDKNSDPLLQKIGRESVKSFCNKTGVNLAGFDLLFPTHSETPLFLEINYFFGRRGLGGSDEFYKTLTSQIVNWLKETGITTPIPDQTD